MSLISPMEVPQGRCLLPWKAHSAADRPQSCDAVTGKAHRSRVKQDKAVALYSPRVASLQP